MKLVVMTQQNHISMATVEQSVVIVIRAKQKHVWCGLDGFILLILVFSFCHILCRATMTLPQATPTQAQQ